MMVMTTQLGTAMTLEQVETTLEQAETTLALAETMRALAETMRARVVGAARAPNAPLIATLGSTKVATPSAQRALSTRTKMLA
jgi:hypothetical protein